MTDFTKTTNFAGKDASAAIIQGATFDTEFDNIATAIISKTNTADLLDTSVTTKSSSLVGWLRAATGAVATTLYKWLGWQNTSVFEFLTDAQIADVQSYAYSLDLTTPLSAAINSLATSGGCLYFPAGGYRHDSALPAPASGLAMKGAGKYSTIVRYQGTATALPADSSDNSILISDMTLDVTGNNAVSLDASRLISSTLRSVRFQAVSGTGQKAISANISNVSWTGYYNVFEDVTFDGAFADAVYVTTSVAQYANRWRFTDPTFLNCVNCFNLISVQGMQIVNPVASENTGTMFLLGSGCDRVKISNADMESNSGGTMWDVDPACNRLYVNGYALHAGTDGIGSGMGIRGVVISEGDVGMQFSGSSTATAISKILCEDDVGVKQSGIQGISSTSTQSKNLCGTVVFAAAATAAVTLPRAEPDAAYRIALGIRANESVWITSQTVNGFTLNSSNATSAAQVDWILLR